MGSRSPLEGAFWGDNDDVGISPHAVDQRCDWLAADAVECHIKFLQWKIPHDAAFCQNSLANYCFNYFADKETRVETLPKQTSGGGAQKHGGTLIAVKINEITSVTDNELISN